MRVIAAAGTGSDRGRDIGREQAGAIQEAATALKSHLAATGRSPAALGRRLSASPMTRVAADLVPDLWAEVTAMAAAARLPLEDVLLLTFLDEVWGLSREAGCSVVARAVPGHPGFDDHPPVPPTTEIGQTMDLPAWTTGRAQVLRTTLETGPTSLVLTYPGCIGLCGANEAGVGVAVNALTHVPVSEQGLGVAFVTRHLLTLSTLADCQAFLTSIPHAAGQAYTIAAPDGLATFEADASGVRLATAPGATASIHTNHPLADADPSGSVGDLSSQSRLDLLLAGLNEHEPLADLLTGDVTVDGSKWGDRHLTFGLFRAVGSEDVVRFLAGDALRAGHREWSKVGFR